MATTLFVYPYKQQSRSALALAKTIGGKVIKLEGSKFRPRKDKLVFNWGSSILPLDILDNCRVVNHPSAVKLVSNKKSFFETMSATEDGPRIPEYTTSNEVAKGWLPKTVFARTVLNGHSGEGIVEINSLEELEAIPDGTLLVKYIPKRKEFRIHVAKDTVFCVQEKLKSINALELGKNNFKIRNHANGYVFARQNIDCPEDVFTQAKKAVKASGLDFGAVDVIWNELRGEAYVLEVNSAPGLEGSTLDDYAKLVETFNG